MSPKVHHDFSRVKDIEDGAPFIMMSYELVNSVAWRSMSINCFRLISFLMAEHLSHAGTENGRLLATYDQLEASGLTRGNISPAIQEAKAYGLLKVKHGRRIGYADSEYNLYTLTFLCVIKPHEETGVKEKHAPTGEWRRTTKDDVKKFKKSMRLAKQKKKENKIKLRVPEVEL